MIKVTFWDIKIMLPVLHQPAVEVTSCNQVEMTQNVNARSLPVE